MSRLFACHYIIGIPDDKLDDVRELKKYLQEELDVIAPVYDVYQLWLNVSEFFHSKWLDINFTYGGDSREDFLEWALTFYGELTTY